MRAYSQLVFVAGMILDSNVRSPLVSIVVPIYNGARYLEATLRSLLQQTFSDFELLAIDDGSTDDSAAIVRSMGDTRIRLIQTSNCGLPRTLNRGMAEARAPYIARCDQDDISYPERLATQYAILESHPEAIALLSHYTKFGDKRRWSNMDKFAVTAQTLRPYRPAVDGCVLASTLFARTQSLLALGGFRTEYYPSDDFDLECRLAQAGPVLLLCEPLVAYRFQTGANTYKYYRQMCDRSRWTIDSYQRRLRGQSERPLEEFLASLPNGFMDRLQRNCRDSAGLHIRMAGQHYLDGRYLKAAVHLALGVTLNPANVMQRVKRSVSKLLHSLPH